MAQPSAPVSSVDYGWQIQVFTAVFLPLEIVVVALRLYTRKMIESRFGWDDGLCLASLICQIVSAALDLAAVQQGGVGHEIGYVGRNDPAQLVVWRKYLTVISIFYFATLNLPKFAILAFFHRVFTAKNTRRPLYAIGAILLGQTIGVFVAALLACQPLEGNWDNTVNAVCINKTALYQWSSIPSIFTDVLMLIFPVPIIWRLHMNTRTRAGLILTFAVGSIGLIAAIFRFAGFVNHSDAGTSFTGVGLLIWTQAEPGAYLVSACLPTYRPLLESWGLGKFVAAWSSRGSSWRRSSNGNAFSTNWSRSRASSHRHGDTYHLQTQQPVPELPGHRSYVELDSEEFNTPASVTSKHSRSSS